MELSDPNKKVFYGFDVGKRFIIETLPQEGNMIKISIAPLEGEMPIQIGFFEKSRENIIQNISIESIIDTIPDGQFRIVLEKMEAPE
jgi:hypothetical protein